ncbi:MAG: VWA domain-containing protein [Akkermansiaceae bacterium]|nr:VWA domain-containing protein [Akkermansiaceae bacterium]
MKNEDKMIDALLQEHARNGGKDDAEFLASLEQRLDEEDGVVSMAHTSGRSGNRAGLGLGIAAALTVAAVGFYGWNEKRSSDMAMYDQYEPELSSELAPSRDAVVHSDRRDYKQAPVAASEKKMQTPGASDESAMHLPAPPPAPAAEAPALRKPTAPSGNAARVIASNKRREVMVPESTRVDPSLDYGDGDDFHDGWGDGNGDGGGGAGFGRVAPQARRAVANHYGTLNDNAFKSPWQEPLSTFSVDVDTASYTNVRRMIQSGQAVPRDAVRIEEMINYFSYDYPQPEGKHPFSVNVETASCPWNPGHRLVKIGLKGKEIMREERPAANLVFLLDVSGSMNSQDKLPLLVDSMKILLKELNADDSVSIVVYAGAQGLALPPTYVDEAGRKTILNKLNNFRSGGSTNGGAGITLAYKVAKKHFVKGGVNRVILGTDGDFNVGVVGTDALVSMVEREAKSGVFMSVLGFGQGNLNDNMLEKITNKGNGNYYYIDNLREGRKVFLDDMMGTMVTIAKDVKIQVEFNPAKVQSYRLIGYANRMLKKEDFKNKRIDAGEIGAGHSVTALYEVVPGDAEQEPAVDDLEYQQRKAAPKPTDRDVVESPNMLTVKLAYKQPDATKETESTYLKTPVIDSGKTWQDASADFKFASGVSLFGMLQRQSEHAGRGTYQLVRQLAEQGRGDDPKGLRTEFSDLVRKVAR